MARRIAAVTGKNAVSVRNSTALAEDGTTAAVNVARKRNTLWTQPVTLNRMQDAADADYYPIDVCNVHNVVLCSKAATTDLWYSLGGTLWKSNGVPDGGGDFTFTKIADNTQAPWTDTGGGGSFTSIKALNDGSWLVPWRQRVYRSTDAGVTWTLVLNAGADGIGWVPFSWSGVDGAHICIGGYLGTEHYVYVSHDYGATWTKVFDPAVTPDHIEVDGTSNNHIHSCVWDPTTDHTAFFVNRGDGVNAMTYRLKQSTGLETYEVDTDYVYFDSGVTITGITLSGTNPVAISTAPALHGLISGDVVRFYGVNEPHELNTTGGTCKEYTITKTSTTAFTLNSTNSSLFTAQSGSMGVFRAAPYGVADVLGAGQVIGAIASGECIYFANEAIAGATVMKLDVANKVAAPVFTIQPWSSSGYYDISSQLISFSMRKWGDIYYLCNISTTTVMVGSIYASLDCENWVCISRKAVAGSESFNGPNQFAGVLNGRAFVGWQDSNATGQFHGEWFTAPTATQLRGFSIHSAVKNLAYIQGTHTNDDSTFTTASHGFTITGGTLSRSTEQALIGTHSLKVLNGAAASESIDIYFPRIYSAMKYLPVNGDVISWRARVYLPEALRKSAFKLRPSLTLNNASGKQTAYNHGYQYAGLYRDGWGTIYGHIAITSDYIAGTDDFWIRLIAYSVPANAYFYIDAVEVVVHKIDVREYYKPIDTVETVADYGSVAVSGTGTSWTVTGLWKPTTALNIVNTGSIPIARIVIDADNYADLALAMAGGDANKFTLTRTVGGVAQTAIVSTESYTPLFDDVVAFAIGTDVANSKLYAKLRTPMASSSMEDANTGIGAPASVSLGPHGVTVENGCGAFNAIQVFDDEFITDADTLETYWRIVNPKMRNKRNQQIRLTQ